MSRYDNFDQAIVSRRVARYRDRTRRVLAGERAEDGFRPLRLQGGRYAQTRAPLPRVAIPYGLLSSAQLRKLARPARTHDRGYGHVTTRRNVPFNGPRLPEHRLRAVAPGEDSPAGRWWWENPEHSEFGRHRRPVANPVRETDRALSEASP